LQYDLLAGLVCAVLVSGCGGGGGDSSSSVPETSADGLWIGTMDSGSDLILVDEAITALVLDDGTYWVWYANFYYEGLIRGTGTSQSGSFTSSSGRKWSTKSGGHIPYTLSASYIEKESLSGTFRDPFYGTQQMFTASYDPAYELTPSLDAIAGTYSGTAAISLGEYYAATDYLYRRDAQTFTISESGAISATTDGCAFTGSVTPRASGNVYNVAVSIQGTSCYSSYFQGVAYFDAATSTLRLAAVYPPEVAAFVYVGTKLQVAQTSVLAAPALGSP
jgi:hypothetical protein